MKIGFIGLGNMGAPMAVNLIKAGHELTGFDVAGILIEGAAVAASAADAARGQDAVITMLPNGEILRAVYAQITPAGMKGAVFIDCSTVDVDSARAAHKMAQANGLLSVDAPVSGGVGGAEAGTLTFMAGGSDEAFSRAAPLFEIMGRKAVHCGEAGAGQSAKICNNMLLGISMIGTCEAFALAEKLGLSAERLFDVVSTSSGSCWSVNTYCRCPARLGPQKPGRQWLRSPLCRRVDAQGPEASQQALGSVKAQTRGRCAPPSSMPSLLAGRRARDGIISAMIDDVK